MPVLGIVAFRRTLPHFGPYTFKQGYTTLSGTQRAAEKCSQIRRDGACRIKADEGMPVLFVSDLRVAAEFYRDKLGFAIDFLHGHPAFYGSVSRDEACIHLRFCAPTAVRGRP
jgi:hypothetical protein